MHSNWKGGVHVYRKLLERSGVKKACLLCKIENEMVLVAHHIDHNRSNNTTDNLTWLCMNCHHLVHHDEKLDKQIRGLNGIILESAVST